MCRISGRAQARFAILLSACPYSGLRLCLRN